jgi:hypothetical protein
MNENEKAQSSDKKNYCDKDGVCTIEHYPDELNCAFCDIGILRGVCTYRIYFADKCLSPFALVAAREATIGDALRQSQDFALQGTKVTT